MLVFLKSLNPPVVCPVPLCYPEDSMVDKVVWAVWSIARKGFSTLLTDVHAAPETATKYLHLGAQVASSNLSIFKKACPFLH